MCARKLECTNTPEIQAAVRQLGDGALLRRPRDCSTSTPGCGSLVRQTEQDLALTGEAAETE